MPLRYLALGDSYTIGEGLALADNWPMQLARALRRRGIDLDDPQVIATTGWTSEELTAGIALAAPAGRWNLVTLGIGVNDQYRGRSEAAYRAALVDLLDTSMRLAGDGALLMLSIPDWGMTPFARAEGQDAARVSAQIDRFNHVARALCDDRGIAFVDITPLSRDGGDDRAMLVADGLHPSAAMYARWVDAVLPVAQRLLARP